MSPEPLYSRAKIPSAKRSEKGYGDGNRNLYIKDDVEMCHVTKFDSFKSSVGDRYVLPDSGQK